MSFTFEMVMVWLGVLAGLAVLALNLWVMNIGQRIVDQQAALLRQWGGLMDELSERAKDLA